MTYNNIKNKLVHFENTAWERGRYSLFGWDCKLEADMFLKLTTATMDKLQLTGQNLGRLFNSRGVYGYALYRGILIEGEGSVQLTSSLR